MINPPENLYIHYPDPREKQYNFEIVSTYRFLIGFEQI